MVARLPETGSSDVVFPDVPRVEMYAHWSYVLVEAGPDQAAEWRARDSWGESLPDVMFPTDHSWLVTTLWDDDWTCIGGSRMLIDAVLSHPALAERAREIDPSMSMDEACPPGHEFLRGLSATGARRLSGEELDALRAGRGAFSRMERGVPRASHEQA